MKIPGAGGDNVYLVNATEEPTPLALTLHSDLQCVSIRRKGITYYSPMSNVLYFEML